MIFFIIFRWKQVLVFYVNRLPCMKYQDLFSLKNKNKIKILECHLLQILLGPLRVKRSMARSRLAQVPTFEFACLVIGNVYWRAKYCNSNELFYHGLHHLLYYFDCWLVLPFAIVDFLSLKAASKICSRRHSKNFIFLETKPWNFMWIICLADDSHEMSRLIF